MADAQGPSGVAGADGRWHTITCIKYSDGANGTTVAVIVDGVAGPVFHITRPIGNMINNGAVDLGGQGPTANQDSIDGEYQSVSYRVG